MLDTIVFRMLPYLKGWGCIMQKKILWWFILFLVIFILVINNLKFYPKENIYGLAEVKLKEFLEIYNKTEQTIIEDEYIKIPGSVNLKSLPQDLISYKIIKDSIEKRDRGDSDPSLEFLCKVNLYQKNFKKTYIFNVSFYYSPDFLNKIPEKHVNDPNRWIIAWKETE